mgnify:CR=1 FL=1
MLHHKLINPKNIAVVGASNNVQTPGGRVLKNLIDHNFKGELFAVNPKETEVQGVKCFQNIKDIPSVDVAIIAIAAKFTLETIKILVKEKNTKGFIIFSAGFSEKDEEGKKIAEQVYGTTDITDDQRLRINRGETTKISKIVFTGA